ncbi:MAG: hypothetical protein HLUCCA11_11920 [Phormidesmis priestleyi Ana]|uniref:Uncharacterized protein n=1 Tax=Phormidesmis priestleyi Ana TaxID=1666911 RepID=A0A0P7YWC9_9CYAN|nr:MAG: hypothetical protein HLUCCA11_11920 [Phormidesmis priestleyi Ana]
MTPFFSQTGQLNRIILALLGTYFFAYAVARIEVFHGVETYPNNKMEGRHLYVAKKDQAPGEGWEYKVFFPAIKLEELLRNF